MGKIKDLKIKSIEKQLCFWYEKYINTKDEDLKIVFENQIFNLILDLRRMQNRYNKS